MASGEVEIKSVQASCLCGKATHTISLPAPFFPLATTLCHCNSCRHMTGFMAFNCLRMPAEYKPDPQLFDKLEVFQFSPKIEQFFCGTCGAHVIERSTTRSSPSAEPKVTFGIMSGTLKQVDGVGRITGHIFVGDTRDGGIADLLPRWQGQDVPRWAQYDDKDDMLPLYWHDEAARQTAKHPAPALHAYCKCGGVNFWILRAKEAVNASKPTSKRPDSSDSGAMCTPELARHVREESGKYLACNCVCDSCRSGAGQEITSWAMVPKSDIHLDAEGQTPLSLTFGTLKSYQSSPGHTRYFCSGCGAKIFYQSNKDEDTIDVGVGLFDAAEGARADSWVEWQLQRVGFGDDAKGRADSLLHALEEGSKEFLKHGKA